jgi:hypothetical protein
MSLSETDRIAEAFLACTLPKLEWTHRAHLRVGLWHALRYPVGDAIDRLRDAIRTFNESVGGVNSETAGYHETITRAYLHLIAHFVQNNESTRPIDELVERMIEHIGDKDHLMLYYSRELLMSPLARREWVEPDLRELPVLLKTTFAKAMLMPSGQSSP